MPWRCCHRICLTSHTDLHLEAALAKGYCYPAYDLESIGTRLAMTKLQMLPSLWQNIMEHEHEPHQFRSLCAYTAYLAVLPNKVSKLKDK